MKKKISTQELLDKNYFYVREYGLIKPSKYCWQLWKKAKKFIIYDPVSQTIIFGNPIN